MKQLSYYFLNLLRKFLCFSIAILIVLMLGLFFQSIHIELDLILNVILLIIAISIFQKADELIPKFVSKQNIIQDPDNFLIEEKTKQVIEQYHKIQDLMEQQSNFMAVTAHEFRTPLSIALFQVQDILEAESDSLDFDKIKTIEKSLKSLKKLTQNLFDVQQYDLNKVELKSEKVDIHEFVENAFNGCQKLSNAKKLKCIFKSSLKKRYFCEIDKQQILQVFHNLYANAIKFSPEKGTIRVNLTQTSEGILIKVIDSGRGVVDKNKEIIFEKFQTEKPSSSTGIGLGLYLCKKILDLHKGKIWVEDASDGGAMFCVMLPVA